MPKGGHRKGSGRKPVSYKYKVVGFKVPIQKIDEFKSIIKPILERLRKESKNNI